MSEPLLVLNAGSATLKAALYTEAHPGLSRLAHFHVDYAATTPSLTVKRGSERQQHALATQPVSIDTALDAVLEAAAAIAGTPLRWFGHRIVHGGDHFGAPALLDEQALAALHALEPLAPLHQPFGLAIVDAMRSRFPGSHHVGCFDTSFHQQQPALARRYALPEALHRQGLHGYGFHGLSYAYIAARLRQQYPTLAAGRVVVAHLGSGASLCAMRDGKSLATTMGFSALEGVPMSTRCGRLDPGVLLYLLRQGHDADSLEHLLYRESGWLGVSGVSSDMRTLMASQDPAAETAIALFCLRTAEEIARLCTHTGGLDTLVFTAGIGEHQPTIRARICAHLAWLGIVLDDEANQQHGPLLAANDSRATVLVMPTDEEQVIAEATFAHSRAQARN